MFSCRTIMVVKEKVKKTHGSQAGLDMAFADEPDFVCFDKATQTSFGEKLDAVTQEQKACLYTTRLFLPGKERYYVVKTKTRVQESACTVQPKSELGDRLVKEKQKKEDANQCLEYDKSVTLQPAEKDLNEVQEVCMIRETSVSRLSSMRQHVIVTTGARMGHVTNNMLLNIVE